MYQMADKSIPQWSGQEILSSKSYTKESEERGISKRTLILRSIGRSHTQNELESTYPSLSTC